VSGSHPRGRITLLAWSPDGQRLAIAFGPSSAGLTEVIDVELRARRGAALEDSYGISSFTWSDDDDLLAGISGPGRGRTVLFRRTSPPDPALVAWDASWSGSASRWFLAHRIDGWAVMDTLTLSRVGPIRDSANWVVARWCCPPVPVITLAPAPGP
jgi:hypothetical protein